MRRIIKILFIATLFVFVIVSVAMFALFRWQENQLERTFQHAPLTLPSPNAEAIVLDDVMTSKEVLLSAEEVEYWIWQERPPHLEALNIEFKDGKYHVQASWKNDDSRYTNIAAIFTASWNPDVVEIEESLQDEVGWSSTKGYWTDFQFESLKLGEQDILEWQEWVGFAGESTSEYDFLTPFWMDFRHTHPEVDGLFNQVEDCQIQNDQLRLIMNPLPVEP